VKCTVTNLATSIFRVKIEAKRSSETSVSYYNTTCRQSPVKMEVGRASETLATYPNAIRRHNPVKMEAKRSSETLVPYHNTIPCHNTEDLDFKPVLIKTPGKIIENHFRINVNGEDNQDSSESVGKI
jgi:hypothetical protein